MLCVEILHNGKRLCVMGHEKAESMQVSLFYVKRANALMLTTHADVSPTADLSEALSWLRDLPAIREGDTIELRLAADLVPDPGHVTHSFGKRVTGEQQELFCSFCGRSQHKVKRLIAGPRVFICNECVDLCNDVIRDDDKSKQTRAP